MSVSMVSSSVPAQSHQRPQGPGKEIRQGIDTLRKAVESGDLTATQSAYESLSKLQSDKQGGSGTSSASNAASDAKDPLSKLLNSVGEALKTGDVGAVQQAVAQNGPPGGGPGGAGGAGGPPPGGPPPGGGSGGGSDEVRDAVGGLAQSLQSGDASSAQDSLDALTKLLTAQDEEDEDGDDSTSTSTSTTSSTASNSFLDTLKSSLNDIGSALQSGDMASAQKLFSSLTPRGSQGVNILA